MLHLLAESEFVITFVPLTNGTQSDDQFVEKVVQLYEDESLWATLQHTAQDYIRRHSDPEVMRKTLADALSGPAR
jgi:hypothetical protein